jgi:hypothetical protein
MRVWSNNTRLNVKEVERSDTDWGSVVEEWDKWQVVLNRVINLRVAMC